MNIGTMLQIVMRLMSHSNEISKAMQEVKAASNSIERLVPQVQLVLVDAGRVITNTRQLLGQLAPELIQTDVQEIKFDVKWLQQSLNTLMNAGLVVDGDYGQLTAEAVKNFQRAHGLTVDGWAGVMTEAKILELLGAPR